jgi:hypothetical protein
MLANNPSPAKPIGEIVGLNYPAFVSIWDVKSKEKKAAFVRKWQVKRIATRSKFSLPIF